MARIHQNRLQQLIDLIDSEALDDFLTRYRESLSLLKPFERVALLLRACRSGSLQVVKTILDEDPVMDVNCRHPSTNYSPLMIAIRAQRDAIIKYLIQETEADVNCTFGNTEKDDAASTCLHEALRQGDVSTVMLLVKHGVVVTKSHLYVAVIECFRPRHKVVIL